MPERVQPQPPRQATTCARSPSAQPCARPSPPAPPRSSLARVRTLRLQTILPMDRRLRKTSTLDIGTEYCPRRPPMPVHAGTDRRIAVCIAPSLAAAASDTPTPSPHRARPAAAALTYPAETVTPTGMPTTLSVPRSSGAHRGTPMVVRACYGRRSLISWLVILTLTSVPPACVIRWRGQRPTCVSRPRAVRRHSLQAQLSEVLSSVDAHAHRRTTARVSQRWQRPLCDLGSGRAESEVTQRVDSISKPNVPTRATVTTVLFLSSANPLRFPKTALLV